MRISLDLGDWAGGQKTAEPMNDPALRDVIAEAPAGYTRKGGRGPLKNLLLAAEGVLPRREIPGN